MAVVTQETELVEAAATDEGLTQENIFQQFAIEEVSRQQKEADTLALSPSQDIIKFYGCWRKFITLSLGIWKKSSRKTWQI